jgi:hypothetical protein
LSYPGSLPSCATWEKLAQLVGSQLTDSSFYFGMAVGAQEYALPGLLAEYLNAHRYTASGKSEPLLSRIGVMKVKRTQIRVVPASATLATGFLD